nr:hypothetical protein CFP56_62456 [Quercus suber]
MSSSNSTHCLGIGTKDRPPKEENVRSIMANTNHWQIEWEFVRKRAWSSKYTTERWMWPMYSAAQGKTAIYCSAYITLLSANHVFDELFVKIWKHRLECPVMIVSVSILQRFASLDFFACSHRQA